MLATILPFCTTASHPYSMHLAQSALEKENEGRTTEAKMMIAVLICCCMLPVNQAFASRQVMKMCAWHDTINQLSGMTQTLKGCAHSWHMGRQFLLKRCIHMSTDI